MEDTEEAICCTPRVKAPAMSRKPDSMGWVGSVSFSGSACIKKHGLKALRQDLDFEEVYCTQVVDGYDEVDKLEYVPFFRRSSHVEGFLVKQGTAPNGIIQAPVPQS